MTSSGRKEADDESRLQGNSEDAVGHQPSAGGKQIKHE